MTPSTLQRVRRAAWRVWQVDVSSRPNGDWADLGDLVCHATGLDHRPWNAAFLTSHEGLERLDAARSWFAARLLPWGLVVPEEIVAEPVGMRPVTQLRLMTRPLSGLPGVPDMQLTWGDGASAAEIQDAAFSDAPGTNIALLGPKLANGAVAVVTASAEGRPISTATLVVADGVAAVFGVGTLPDATGQGYGGAVTLAVLHRAVELGCDLAFLNPTDAGYALYCRLGFTDGSPWQVWADAEVSRPSP